MELLIDSIYDTLKDYREHENDPLVRISKQRIKQWIAQFEENEKLPILTELDAIFKKRYCSKDKLLRFLESVVNVLTEDYNEPDIKTFLENANFLNLQKDDKSQKIMLSTLDELLKQKYNTDISQCGTSSHKYSIYIDDVLCSGQTLYNEIKDWVKEKFDENKANEKAVQDGSTTLIFAYIYIHNKNFHKKIAQMKKNISIEFANNLKMYRHIEIDNTHSEESKFEFLIPQKDAEQQEIVDYEVQIKDAVENHMDERGWDRGKDFFYRPIDKPIHDSLFTTSENRNIMERAFMRKGIEILQNAHVNIPNMRALGYSLPSVKDFGFGALCFTWRNVPNNSPLVFWYRNGIFTPLFEVRRGR